MSDAEQRRFASPSCEGRARTGAAIGQAVMNPVETVSSIPAGVGRFFQSAATTISRATKLPVGTNSSQAAGASNAARDFLGVNRATRRIAKQVGADPYTTNPVLAKQLDDLARASVAGGISLDVALAVSTAGVGTVRRNQVIDSADSDQTLSQAVARPRAESPIRL